jgi:superfamily II DNA or RNA helicase
MPGFTLRPHQNAAMKDIRLELSVADRALYVSACGSGKTLVGYKTMVEMSPNVTLLLFPSLALINQTNDAYINYDELEHYSPLYVCSDSDISDESEDFHVNDCKFSPTTDTGEIIRYLTSDSIKKKIIFVTYHSSKLIVEAVRECGVSIDLAIYDEAHRVAQKIKSTFAATVSDDMINIEKRLFVTATPKHINIDKENTDFYSMDDKAVFGKKCHDYSLRQAISDEVVVDYKIVINLIDSPVDLLNARSSSHSDSDALYAAKVASLQSAMAKTGAKKTIAFAERIEKSKNYEKASRAVGSQLKTFHIDSTMTIDERKTIMSNFEEAEGGIIFNANLLSEGVDAPELEMVAFLEKASSSVNVVQRLGRALRKNENHTDKVGYIFIPAFIGAEDITDAGIDFSSSREVKKIVEIINFLKESDENLAYIIDSISDNEGDKSRLNAIIQINLDPDSLFFNIYDSIKNSILSIVVDKLKDTWMVNFKAVSQYKEFYNILPNKRKHSSDGINLGQWVANQIANHRKGLLSERKAHLLRGVGVQIDYVDRWMDRFELLKLEFNKKPHPYGLRVKEIKDKDLINFILNNRKEYRSGILSKSKEEMLNSIGMVWNENENHRNMMIHLTKKYISEKNNAPARDVVYQGENIGIWYKEIEILIRHNKISIDMLPEEVTRFFNLETMDARWMANYEALVRFTEQNRQPVKVMDVFEDISIGKWLYAQRSSFEKGRLSQNKASLLASVGFSFNISKKRSWEDSFEEFKSQLKKHKTILSVTKNNHSLDLWLKRQRSKYREGILDGECSEKLQSIGVELQMATDEEIWEKWYFEYVEYVAQKKENPKISLRGSLGSWLSGEKNKYRNGELDETKSKLLEDTGLVFESSTDQRHANFKWVKEFVAKHGRLMKKDETYNGKDMLKWFHGQKVDPEAKGVTSKETIAFQNEVRVFADTIRLEKKDNFFLEKTILYKKYLTGEYKIARLGDDVALKTWVNRTSKKENGDLLAPSEIEILCAHGMSPINGARKRFSGNFLFENEENFAKDEPSLFQKTEEAEESIFTPSNKFN